MRCETIGFDDFANYLVVSKIGYIHFYDLFFSLNEIGNFDYVTLLHINNIQNECIFKDSFHKILKIQNTICPYFNISNLNHFIIIIADQFYIFESLRNALIKEKYQYAAVFYAINLAVNALIFGSSPKSNSQLHFPVCGSYSKLYSHSCQS